MNEDYENFKKFIITDFKIKKELVDMRPPLDTDAINLRTILKYTNNAYDSLRFIIRELRKMIEPYDQHGLFTKKIDELSKKWLYRFINCKLDKNKLTSFYQNDVTDMREEFVNSVKRECCGYSVFRFPIEALKMCNSINELLHVMHAYIMNNEYILQSVNVIDTKQKDACCKITLYGEENEVANSIFNNFPNELAVGWTDIVSFGDIGKVVMMVRDRGHALSIEIDYDQDDIMVRYFIPKLCNIELINKLPGINKVSEDADAFSGATGRFATTKDKLTDDLFAFIAKVPMDEVMTNKNHR